MQTNEPNQEKLTLAMGLIAKQAGSGKPFSLFDFCRDLNVTIPQFFIEQRMFTFSAQRYEIEGFVGGRGRDKKNEGYLPDNLRKQLTEYVTSNGTTKKSRFRCSSDNRAKPIKKKQRFLLAQLNFTKVFKGENLHVWSLEKGQQMLNPYGFEPATAMELLDFRLPNDRVFSNSEGPARICSLDGIEILKGNRVESFGFLVQEHQSSYPARISHEFWNEIPLDGKNDFLLVKEIG